MHVARSGGTDTMTSLERWPRRRTLKARTQQGQTPDMSATQLNFSPKL
jgi:hypothetical protein